MTAKTVAKVWNFASSSGSGSYETLRYADGETSCNCPGWTRRTDANGTRSCKHTRSVDMGAADRECTSMHDYAAPAPATTAARVGIAIATNIGASLRKVAAFGGSGRKLSK